MPVGTLSLLFKQDVKHFILFFFFSFSVFREARDGPEVPLIFQSLVSSGMYGRVYLTLCKLHINHHKKKLYWRAACYFMNPIFKSIIKDWKISELVLSVSNNMTVFFVYSDLEFLLQESASELSPLTIISQSSIWLQPVLSSFTEVVPLCALSQVGLAILQRQY